MNTEFYTYVLQAHNFLRWIILLLLIILGIRSLTGGRPFTSGDRKLGSTLTIFTDITLLIGVYQWISGAWGLKRIQEDGLGEVMKNDTSRFFAVEHFLMMIFVVIFIHVAGSYAKKEMPDPKKHRRRLIFYGLALLLTLIAIPWPFREELGRPWIRF